MITPGIPGVFIDHPRDPWGDPWDTLGPMGSLGGPMGSLGAPMGSLGGPMGSLGGPGVAAAGGLRVGCGAELTLHSANLRSFAILWFIDHPRDPWGDPWDPRGGPIASHSIPRMDPITSGCPTHRIPMGSQGGPWTLP